MYGEGEKSKLGVGVAACHSMVPGVARRLMQRSYEIPHMGAARQRPPCVMQSPPRDTDGGWQSATE